MRAAEGTGPPTKKRAPKGTGARFSKIFQHPTTIADSANPASIFSTPTAIEVERRMDVAYFAGKAVRA